MTKEELKKIIEGALWKYWDENSSMTWSAWYYDRIDEHVDEIIEMVDI